MTYNKVTLFNQLTCNELADLNVFDSILSDNYTNFQYFYDMIKSISLSKISSIICLINDNQIAFIITSLKNNYVKDITETISYEHEMNNTNDEFNLSVETSGREIKVYVSSNNCNEGE